MARIDYRHSLETIRKIAESNKGKKRSIETRRKLSLSHKGKTPWEGKKHTQESKSKMSQSAKRSFSNGRMPWNFIEDRTKLKKQAQRWGNAHKFWSISVKKRDKWKCRLLSDLCNGRVEAHHIKSWSHYPALRYEIKNGITLCRFHHPRKREDEIKLESKFLKMIRAR